MTLAPAGAAPVPAPVPSAPAAAAVEGADGVRLDAAALALRASGLAAALAARGVGPRRRVAVAAAPSAVFAAALRGVLAAGGVAVPLALGLPAAERRRRLDATRAALSLRAGRDGGGDGEPPALDLDAPIPDAPVPGAVAAARPRPGAGVVVWTDGVAGPARPAEVTPEALDAAAAALAGALGLGAGDRVLVAVDPSSAAGLAGLWAALAAGATAVLDGAAGDPGRLCGRAAAAGATVVWVAAAAWRRWLDAAAGEPAPAGLRAVVVAGEPIPGLAAARWLASPLGTARLFSLLSIAEAGGAAALAEVGGGALRAGAGAGAGAAGLAPLGCGLAVLEAAGAAAPGEGELALTGELPARGYLGDPAATADRFRPDPCPGAAAGARALRTGDRAVAAGAGRVAVLGRLAGRVPAGALPLDPGAVADALRAHRAVADAGAAIVPGDAGEPALAAWAEPRPGARATEAELAAFLERRLPPPLRPRWLALVERLPRTPAGRPDLRALAASLPAAAAAPVDGAGVTAARVAAAMGEVLGGLAVAPGDDFFQLGGHSLLGMRLAALLAERHRLDLTVADVLAAPTPAALAARLGGAGAADAGRSAAGPAPAPRLPPVRPQPRGARAPLSSSQERVFFLQQLSPGSLAYHFHLPLRLTGPLDRSLLGAALTDVCRRHEVYRSSVQLDDGLPVQVVHPPSPAALPLVDLGGVAEGRREPAAMAAIGRAIRRAVDPGEPRLVRWVLFRLAPERHLLLHHEHHLVHDGWSLNLFLRELFEGYHALAAGRPAPAPPPVQFADFAIVQRRWMAGPDAERQLAYWRERLAGIEPLSGLPYDRPRPREQAFRGACFRVELPARLCDPLRRLARERGATLFMVFQAAYFGLLHRYTGARDLAAGTAVGNRRWPGSEDLYGMLVNNVVLRCDLGGDPTFDALLGQVREVALAAWERQELSFERVVEALRPRRDPGVNPLFQTSFSFHDSPLPELSAGGLGVELIEGLSNGSAKFEINVVGIPRREQRPGAAGAAGRRGVTLIWEYDRDLFDRATMERMAASFRRLLVAAAGDPGRRLSHASALSAAERRQVALAAAPAAAWPEGATLDRLLAAQAARTPERIAVEDDATGQEITFGDLAERAGRLAAHLAALGAGAETRVALHLERSPELIVAVLAVLAAGGAFVPLDPDLPPERRDHVLADSGAAVVVTREALAGRLPALPGVRICRLDAEASAIAARRPAPPPPADPEQTAYVLYTSGSTGWPKGVAVPHRAIVNHMRWMERDYPLEPGDRVLHKTPLSFDASLWEVFAPLMAGARLVVARADGHRDLRYLAEAVGRCGITVLQVVPSLLRMLLEEPALGQARSLARLFAGGEALPRELAERARALLGCRVINLYGPTEAAIDATAGDHDPAEPWEVVAIGRPIANVVARVADPRTLAERPPGAPGELLLGGPALARGYLGRPALTAERFVPDPAAGAPGDRLYRTGDLARRRGAGLAYLGRVDQQVKVRGQRIEPGEVEAALASHPAVLEAAVGAPADAAGERRLVAWVVARPGGPAPDPAILREHLARRLPPGMVPSAFGFLPALPRTASGKLDRRALPALEAAEERRFVAPGTEVEEAVAEIWAELIGLSRVGATDDFFDLGGHSLHATRLMHRVRHHLGVALSVATLYRAPTVERFAAAVEARLVEQIAGGGVGAEAG